MRNRLLMIFLVSSFALHCFAQASGGQINRIENKKSNTKISKPIQKEQFEVNGVKFVMVAVDGGSFTMGMSKERAEKIGNQDASPAHRVTLSSYKISTTEVTHELLWAVMNPDDLSTQKGNKMPVKVTWIYAVKFLNTLSNLLGKTFRLPTEAEWEFAAKGGNRSKGYKYPGSNRVDEVAWVDRNSNLLEKEREVGKKKPNEVGLYDMCGNVDEWCLDWYAPYNSEAQVNPQGPETGKRHVMRGGDYSSAGDTMLPEFRSGEYMENCKAGFRFVLVD
jgi:formylglycine-generating enzyme required for sulfatase activity